MGRNFLNVGWDGMERDFSKRGMGWDEKWNGTERIFSSWVNQGGILNENV